MTLRSLSELKTLRNRGDGRSEPTSKVAVEGTASGNKTPLVVDSASLYEIVATMDLRGSAYGWARESAEALTTTLLRVSELRIAGSPGSSSHATGQYGILLKGIEEKLNNVRFVASGLPETIRARCRDDAITWAKRNSELLRILLATLLDDERNFKPWLENAMRLAWNEHSSRLGGLFNEEFLGAIAEVLDVTEDEIEALFALSKSSRFLNQCQAVQVSSKTVTAYVIKAYVVSALIRGMFHQLMAEADGCQLTQHPFRAWAYRQTSGTADADGVRAEIPVPDPQRMLSHLLLHDALLEEEASDRARKWVERVAKTTKAIKTIKPDLSPQHSVDKSVALAVEFGAKLDMIAPKRWADRLVTTVQSLGVLTASTLTHAAFGTHSMLAEAASATISAATPWLPDDRAKSALQARLAQRELKRILCFGPGVVGHTEDHLPSLNLASDGAPVS